MHVYGARYGVEVEYNDCVIHILTAKALIKYTLTQITTTQSAWTPSDTSGLDHLRSPTSDNNNIEPVFTPFPQVCMCVCVSYPCYFFGPVVIGRTNILRAELPWSTYA